MLSRANVTEHSVPDLHGQRDLFELSDQEVLEPRVDEAKERDLVLFEVIIQRFYTQTIVSTLLYDIG